MQAAQAGLAGGGKSQGYPLWDTPHLTIETNRTCNLRCRSCYTLDKRQVKKLEEVKEEVGLGLKKRNLETITLLGGEPTLYPQLTEVIGHIKSKGLKCQLLTNGQRFLEERGEELLSRIAAAGADRILLHVDAGQAHQRGDIEAVRRKLFTQMERARLHFSLSLTIDREEAGRLPTLLKEYAGFRYFDGILAVLRRDLSDPDLRLPEMGDEYQGLKKGLGVEPTDYVSTNLDTGSVGWLIYLYYMDSRTGKTFGLSPLAYRGFVRLYRLFAGRRPFSLLQPPSRHRWAFLASALIETLMDPRRLFEVLSFIGPGSARAALDSIRFHFVVIQNPPHFHAEKNRYEFCYGCPDATIRNGKLTPVCIADQINPFPDRAFHFLDPQLRTDVFSHLGNL